MPMDSVDSEGAPAAVTAGASISAAPTAPTKPTKKLARKKKKHALPELCSPEDVVSRDVAALLGQEAVDLAVVEGTEWDSPFGPKEEVELEISMIASNGARPAIHRVPVSARLTNGRPQARA